MIPSLFINAAVLSTALAAPSFPFGRRQASCPPSHLIVARGSLEPPGPGSLATLAEKVMQENPGTTLEAVDYPATIENYDVSSTAGAKAVEQQLSTFVQRCPSSKVVMMGFSQGAQIVGDALGGGGIQGVSKFSPPVGRAVSDQVSAVVMYGDPRHVVRAPFNVGNATNDGIFPRSMNQTLDAFAAKTKAFCNARDPFCASGDQLAVHLAYPQEFDNIAAAFVTSKLQGTPAPAIAGSPQLSNSTARILVSNSTASASIASTASTISAARARSVIAPWSNALSRFTTSRISPLDSAKLRARSDKLKPRSPWAFANLRFERQFNGTTAVARRRTNGTSTSIVRRQSNSTALL